MDAIDHLKALHIALQQALKLAPHNQRPGLRAAVEMAEAAYQDALKDEEGDD